jgi:uncharacterized protein (UPF0210 family)
MANAFHDTIKAGVVVNTGVSGLDAVEHASELKQGDAENCVRDICESTTSPYRRRQNSSMSRLISWISFAQTPMIIDSIAEILEKEWVWNGGAPGTSTVFVPQEEQMKKKLLQKVRSTAVRSMHLFI